MPEDEPHYLGRFHQLVGEAACCGRATDNFDLTGDAISKSKFAMLNMEAKDAALALIDFIVAHHRELYKEHQK